MKEKLLFLIGISLLVISCTQISTPGTVIDQVDPPSETVQSLVLDKTVLSIDVSETSLITATATSSVTWDSSDTSIATVANGLVTPIKVGFVKISAIMSGITKTCEVTITDREIKKEVSDYSKTYYASDEITKTGMLTVSGSTDSFTGKISNTIIFASIETVNSIKTMVSFGFSKSISGNIVTYNIHCSTTQSTSYLYLSTITPIKIKLEDGSIYEPEYLIRSNSSSSGAYTSQCLYTSNRIMLNKMRSEKNMHSVRITTTSYGNIDISVPDDFFVYLSQI